MSTNKDEAKQSLPKQIAITAILLAICIASQFLKNLSVYITGPIINLCLVLAVMMAGLPWGLILAVVTPVTAFFIAANPVMQMVPGILPLIMGGNAVLVLLTALFVKPSVLKKKPYLNVNSIIGAVVSSLVKGLFMGLTISLWLLPTFIPAESPLSANMGVFQFTFSVTQFITALIGFVLFFALWPVHRKVVKKG